MIRVAPGATVGRQNHQDGQCLGSLDRIVHLASGSPNQMKGGDAGSQLIRLRLNLGRNSLFLVTVCLFMHSQHQALDVAEGWTKLKPMFVFNGHNSVKKSSQPHSLVHLPC